MASHPLDGGHALGDRHILVLSDVLRRLAWGGPPAGHSVLLAQYPARNIPTQLSDVLDLPDHVRHVFGTPFEAKVYVGDLSRSVLGDPVADPGHLALVEITRTLLHAYRNPGAATDPRLATLGPLFDTVLEHFGPLEVKELFSYVVHVFGERSPIVAIIIDSLGKVVKEMYVTVADKLRADGRKEGRKAGRAAGLREGRKAGRAAGRKEGRKEGHKEGRAAAMAAALLRVLRHRLGPVPMVVRRRVVATDDEQQLQRWFDRALEAAALDEVFQPLDA